MSVVGGLAYVAEGAGGLRVIDVSDPAVPGEVGWFDTSGYAQGVSVVGGLAYVADDSSGLCVIDAAPEPRPFLLQLAALATVFAIGGYRGRCRR